MKKKENLPEKYKNKIDIETAFKLRFVKGLTLSEIGKCFNCSASAVQQRLDKFIKELPAPEDLQVFKDNLVDLGYSGLYKLFMSLLDGNAIEKAKLWERSNTFGMLFDKLRLLENKSTQNIAHKEISKEIEQLEEAIRDYKNNELNKKLNNP